MPMIIISCERGSAAGPLISFKNMQNKYSSRRSNAGGFALIMTLLTIGVALVIFAGVLSWSFSNTVVTQRNNQYNMSEYAAEAGVEYVMGRIDRDFINASISNASVYATLPASIDQSTWPVRYIYSDTNGTTGAVSVVIMPTSSSTVSLNSQYSGLSGLVQSNDIYAIATPVGQPYTVPATIHESTQFATIPLFQFAIFYNVNLEISPGGAMTIAGPVFCNQSIWEGSGSCTFSSRVQAVGTNYWQKTTDPFALNYGYNGSVTPTFSMSGQPVNGANSLVMPIGTNNDPATVLGILNLPPPPYTMGTAQAYGTSNGMAYPANQADLYITNYVWGTNDGAYTPRGTNLAVFFQDQPMQTLTQLPYDFYIMTNRTAHIVYTTNFASTNFATNIVFAGMSWITNSTFRDWREGWNGGSGPGKRVEAVEIDVGQLNVWLTNAMAPWNGSTNDQIKVNHSGHHIGGIYVYTSVALTGTQLPAVRVVNGAQLPNLGPYVNNTYGLTVATPFPMYVLGDYNSQNNGHSALGLYGSLSATANTLPAALLADSVTILSDNWDDSVTNKKPNASSTTVNAAMLEGIVPSNPNISGNYSGGVENFLRLLENWNGDTLTYNGSIVVLFYSQYATNSWVNPGGYYEIPTRHWAFDMNFQTASKLPPMTPASRAIVRGNWFSHK